jgi:hypothetical protein
VGEVKSDCRIVFETLKKGAAYENTRRWGDIIKMGLPKIVCEGVGWIKLNLCTAYWRSVVNVVMEPRVP